MLNLVIAFILEIYENVSEEIEIELKLAGCSAIEDKL
jgi:hypothetical protein